MTEASIDELTAKQAIADTLARYCRGLDRMDRQMVLEVWHPSATAVYEPWFEGTGEDFVDWVWPVHEGMQRHSHQITNVLVEVDGDHAVSEAYVTVCLRTRPVQGRVVDIVSRGRYLDRWSKRDGRWAIDDRRYVDDLTHEVPVDDTSSREGSSRRDRDDPSYSYLSR